MNILEARRRTLGKGVYKKTVEGNPAIAQGSLARMYPGITMQGWTEQNGTPTPETPVPIVSAGTQNQDAGKWEYEITIANEQTDPDKNQTVTLTADRPLTKWDKLEKRNGQWGWVYKSAEIVLDGSEYWTLYTNNKSENLYGFRHNISNLVMENTSEDRGFIDKIPSISRGISLTNKMAAQFGASNTNLYILLSREYFSEHSVSALTEWLSENPLMALYETSEETFVPLSESEQKQMNALHTFRPTTVLSNDCGCNMELTYKTKKSLEVTD